MCVAATRGRRRCASQPDARTVDPIAPGGTASALNVALATSTCAMRTRKSARCDRLRCAACDVCVDAALDFSKVAPADLDVEYAPYVADDDDDDDVGFVDHRPAMIAVG